MEPTRGSSSSNTLQLGRAQNESVDNNESFGGSSSSVQWQPKAGAFAHRHNPQLAHIHVVAGSEWSEESEQSQNGSVDCAVEVQVVVQQTQPVKVCLTGQQLPALVHVCMLFVTAATYFSDTCCVAKCCPPIQTAHSLHLSCSS
jgi:hypothetical protein